MPKDVKSVLINLRVTPQEREVMTQTAQSSGQTVSEMLRSLAKAEAKKQGEAAA